MNNVNLFGRLTADPEVKYTDAGKCVTRITLAVSRDYKNKNGEYDADFIPVIIWGKAAEVVGNNTFKGYRLIVEGQIQVRSYNDTKTKQKRYITEVVARSVNLVEPKPGKREADFRQFGPGAPGDDEINF